MSRLTVAYCIPTHGRSQLLREAIDSGLAQVRPPDELVVSDDVGSAEVRALVEAAARQATFPVRYAHCVTGQSQVQNMNNCLRESRCDLTLLLHDDDLLLPGAVEKLAEPFEAEAGLVAAYGKQLFVTHAGAFIPEETELFNRIYRRTPQWAGLQADAILAGIWQQFPNDGYLVRTSVAREVLYRSEFGAATDFDFGLRLAERGKFFFVDEFVSKYRNSLDSVGRGAGAKSDDSAYFGMHILLRAMTAHPRHADEIEGVLRELAPVGLLMAAATGRVREAISWYLGPYHRRKIATPGGIRRGLQLLRAWLQARQRGAGPDTSQAPN